MTEVTRILSQIDQGDPSAAEQLLPLVYDELRKLAVSRMAQEAGDHTLQPTALVHEAYIRLVDTDAVQSWDSRGHFFAAAAEAMRRILIEMARRKKRLKRGGEHHRVDVNDLASLDEGSVEELLDLDAAIEKLARAEPENARIVKLRFFAGRTFEEISEILGVSVVTVKRHWRYARAWLRKELEQGLDSGPNS